MSGLFLMGLPYGIGAQLLTHRAPSMEQARAARRCNGGHQHLCYRRLRREGVGQCVLRAKLHCVAPVVIASDRVACSVVVEVFDTSSSTWKTGLPALPTPRYGLSCEAVAAVIYCIGGIAYHTPSVNTVEAYDVSAGRWLPKASMPTARAFFASTVYEGSIYVLGGDDGTNKLTLVEAYSPATNSWATAAPLPSPARSHFAATTYSAGILMLGGSVDKGLYEHDIDNVSCSRGRATSPLFAS